MKNKWLLGAAAASMMLLLAGCGNNNMDNASSGDGTSSHVQESSQSSAPLDSSRPDDGTDAPIGDNMPEATVPSTPGETNEQGANGNRQGNMGGDTNNGRGFGF